MTENIDFAKKMFTKMLPGEYRVKNIVNGVDKLWKDMFVLLAGMFMTLP